MTHRIAQSLLFVLLISGWLLVAEPLVAQDSTQPAPTKSSSAKSKKPVAPATAEESATNEENAAKATDAEKTQPGKTEEATKKEDSKTDEGKKEEAKNKEDAAPVVESPKLIDIPQGEATAAPRPKVVAVFIFTNGDRIESDDYLITKDAVFINKNGQKTRYSINTVDRDATKAANQARGVEIVFPKSKSEFNLDF